MCMHPNSQNHLYQVSNSSKTRTKRRPSTKQTSTGYENSSSRNPGSQGFMTHESNAGSRYYNSRSHVNVAPGNVQYRNYSLFGDDQTLSAGGDEQRFVQASMSLNMQPMLNPEEDNSMFSIQQQQDGWLSGFDRNWTVVQNQPEPEMSFAETPGTPDVLQPQGMSSEFQLDFNSMFQFPLNEAARAFPGDINFEGHTYSQLPSAPGGNTFFSPTTSNTYELFSPVSVPTSLLTREGGGSGALSDWSFSSEALTDSEVSSAGSPNKMRDIDVVHGLRSKLQFGSVGSCDATTDSNEPIQTYAPFALFPSSSQDPNTGGQPPNQN